MRECENKTHSMKSYTELNVTVFLLEMLDMRTLMQNVQSILNGLIWERWFTINPVETHKKFLFDLCFYESQSSGQSISSFTEPWSLFSGNPGIFMLYILKVGRDSLSDKKSTKN